MVSKKPEKIKKMKVKVLDIDGSTGEGGGQLVRNAVALASVLSQPIRITNVRGNRGNGRRGGAGLKSQHVTSIAWLAAATNAEVAGLSVGSELLEFSPRQGPSSSTLLASLVLQRGPDEAPEKVTISGESAAASTLLIFQAILPFLLFAGTDDAHPKAIEVDISGGTNVSFSPSFEYVDQVLLPTLEERFGMVVERKLHSRGWSAGTASRGLVTFKVHPLRIGTTLQPRGGEEVCEDDFDVTSVDASVVVPADMHADLTRALVRNVNELWPDADVNFPVVEDSAKDTRMYVLLVAQSSSGPRTLRWGRDVLTSLPKKMGDKSTFAEQVARDVVKELFEEVTVGGEVDVYLQDQMVMFQALAEGRTSFPRDEDADADGALLSEAVAKLDLGERRRKDKDAEPFGEGSMHTKTARWVTAQMLPTVSWYDRGRECEGVGVRMR